MSFPLARNNLNLGWDSFSNWNSLNSSQGTCDRSTASSRKKPSPNAPVEPVRLCQHTAHWPFQYMGVHKKSDFLQFIISFNSGLKTKKLVNVAILDIKDNFLTIRTYFSVTNQSSKMNISDFLCTHVSVWTGPSFGWII